MCVREEQEEEEEEEQQEEQQLYFPTEGSSQLLQFGLKLHTHLSQV